MTKQQKMEKAVEYVKGLVASFKAAEEEEFALLIADELLSLNTSSEWRKLISAMVHQKYGYDYPYCKGVMAEFKKVGTVRYVKKAASENILGIMGTLIGVGVTTAFFGGGHLGMSIGGKGYDMGPAWLWGGAAGGAIGHAGDHIRKSRRVK